MINHIKVAKVISLNSPVYDEYGEITQDETTARTITIAISLRTGSTQITNDVKSINSDYIGITSDKDLKETDTIACDGQSYQIDYVNTLGRKTIVYLTRVKQYGD